VAQIHLLRTRLGEARARNFLDQNHSQLKTDPGSLHQFLKTAFEGIAAELENRRQQAVAHASDIIVGRVLETSPVGHGSKRVEVVSELSKGLRIVGRTGGGVKSGQSVPRQKVRPRSFWLMGHDAL
jgi:hypothetical protein